MTGFEWVLMMQVMTLMFILGVHLIFKYTEKDFNNCKCECCKQNN